MVIRELKQRRRQRQRKRHLKINVWDYFVIIASSSYHSLLTEHPVNKLVEAPLKKIQRMKYLLLCVHVDVKTLTLEILRRHLADYVKELY